MDIKTRNIGDKAYCLKGKRIVEVVIYKINVIVEKIETTNYNAEVQHVSYKIRDTYNNQSDNEWYADWDLFDTREDLIASL